MKKAERITEPDSPTQPPSIPSPSQKNGGEGLQRRKQDGGEGLQRRKQDGGDGSKSLKVR